MLAAVGSCGACHTAPDGAPYAGGYAIDTPQGTWIGPNLTPDPTHGIGGWTYADFERAMTRGRSPEGRAYWPAFPYPAYTKLRAQELADLWAYLQTLQPDPRPDEPHRIGRLKRFPALSFWRLLYFDRGAYQDDPSESAVWNRGAYLGEGIGHCGECHSPRNRHGAVRHDQALSGQSDPPEPAPNLTRSSQRLARWTLGDAETFFSLGMTAEGDFVGGEMLRIVEEGTARLSPAERAALATWLLSLDPPDGVPPATPAPREADETRDEPDDEPWM